MAKFHGKVGFVEYAETAPSVYKEVTTEKFYSGDVLRRSNRFSQGLIINDNITVNVQISIIADPYLNSHLPSIKYVNWKGTDWKVTTTDDSTPPRIILTLGDVYNGQQTKSG